MNLHCHSNFSDGRDSIKRLVKRALKLNLSHLAITDHFSDSWKAGIIPTLSNSDKIIQYVDKILSLRQSLAKNQESLRIYVGIEIDLGCSEGLVKDLVNPDDFDLVLFEYLEDFQGVDFIKEMIEHWRISTSNDHQLPIFGLAHFDPSPFLEGGLAELMTFLQSYQIYFEFNSRYPDYYSPENGAFFEQLKEKKISVAVGSDAHRLGRLNDLDDPMDMVRLYSLQENLKNLIRKLNSI